MSKKIEIKLKCLIENNLKKEEINLKIINYFKERNIECLYEIEPFAFSMNYLLIVYRIDEDKGDISEEVYSYLEKNELIRSVSIEYITLV